MSSRLKVAPSVVSFLVVVNLVMWMMVEADIEPVSGLAPAISIENLVSTFNATRIAKTWSTWAHDMPYVGDIVGGTIMMVNALASVLKVGVLVSVGFPVMLAMMGAPLPFTVISGVIFAMIWFWYILELMSGRRTLEVG